MTVMPHNHQMWAVIGIYSGREDNVFWRRLPDGSGRIEAAGARALSVGDAEPLGHNIIHSVTNPIPRLTGAIHIYGGDFFAAHRSEWDAETLMEGPMDGKKAVRRFEEANEMYERFYRPQVAGSIGVVMPGLVPDIHVFGSTGNEAWMAGTRPGLDDSQ